MSKQRLLASLTLASLLGGCALEDEPLLSADESEIYALSTAMWQTSSIPVCWENDGRLVERAYVEAAIKRTWMLSSGVSFTGWGLCQPGARGIRIRHQDAWPHTKGLGTQLDGKADGMVLNFDFTFRDTDGSQPFSGCLANKERCIEAIAIHEFGHAMGFAHEQNRPDTPSTCTTPAQGTSGDTMQGGWDLMSVMNYCNPTFNGGGILSSNDVAGAIMYYGFPAGADTQFLTGDVNGDRFGDLIEADRRFGSLPRCTSSRIGAFDVMSCSNHGATIYNQGTPEQRFLAGDFNGDGKTDVAQVYRNWGSIPRCLATATGWDCSNPAAELHSGAGDTNERRFHTGKFFANDNRTGIIQTWRAWGTIPLCRATDAGWTCTNPPATIYNANSMEQEFHVIDVNGDGLDDVIQTSRTWGSLPVCFADGAGGWSCRNDAATIYNLAAGEMRFLTGDFDGDGHGDVIQTSRSFGSIPLCTSVNDGTGWSCTNEGAWIPDSGSHEQQFLVGDFDGDGRDDVAMTFRGWGSIPVCYATAQRTWSCRNDAAAFPNTGSPEQRFVAVDLNRDGKTDIVSTHRAYGTYTACYSTGTSWRCESKGRIYDPGPF